ncbi:MAG: hypothetical protein DMF75_03960 [Acidobacteria bacterium]|nr:MAG: hypothetical protein DMF75_03960 [Acidobacteriota bacterium]
MHRRDDDNRQTDQDFESDWIDGSAPFISNSTSLRAGLRMLYCSRSCRRDTEGRDEKFHESNCS